MIKISTTFFPHTFFQIYRNWVNIGFWIGIVVILKKNTEKFSSYMNFSYGTTITELIPRARLSSELIRILKENENFVFNNVNVTLITKCDSKTYKLV